MNVDCSCPSEAAKDADHEVQKSSEESKSKKYQEMLYRKKKKQKKMEENITSNQVPDYKGNIPLEEIINFINEDVKVSSLTKSAKSSKKHKKKISKKDSLDGDLPTNPIQQKKIELLNDDFQKVIESSYEKKSMDLNNLCDSEIQEVKPSKNCSGECDTILHSTVLEEPKHVSTSKDSFGDCDQFSVVKKKKKLKKTVCSNGLEKSVSGDSCLPGIVFFGDKSSFEMCSKSKKNEANMYVKGNIHVCEQNIPKSKNRPSIKNHIEERESLLSSKKLINIEPKKMSQNLAELPEQVNPKLSELSNFKPIHRKSESSATTITRTFIKNCGSQDIIPCLPIPDRSEFPATEPIVAMNFKGDEETPKPKVFVTPHTKKPESLSKPKSAFNLKHAQALMNSSK